MEPIGSKASMSGTTCQNWPRMLPREGCGSGGVCGEGLCVGGGPGLGGATEAAGCGIGAGWKSKAIVSVR